MFVTRCTVHDGKLLRWWPVIVHIYWPRSKRRLAIMVTSRWCEGGWGRHITTRWWPVFDWWWPIFGRWWTVFMRWRTILAGWWTVWISRMRRATVVFVFTSRSICYSKRDKTQLEPKILKPSGPHSQFSASSAWVLCSASMYESWSVRFSTASTLALNTTSLSKRANRKANKLVPIIPIVPKSIIFTPQNRTRNAILEFNWTKRKTIKSVSCTEIRGAEYYSQRES